MTLTGYNPVQHDVFSSGYPSAPVRNVSPSFTGVGRTWENVGWSVATPTKSFGFVSPSHFLSARHFGGASTLRVFGADGQLHSASQWKTENTNLGVVFLGETVGDLQLGTLTLPFSSSALPRRSPVLDLHTISTTNSSSAYNGLSLRVYGRGPDGNSSTRLGAATVSSVSISGNSHPLTFSRDDVQLESGDSGSPLYAAWTNPDGQPEAALLGNHAAISDTTNLDNFAASFEVINALNGFMNDDGRALRVAGNVSNTWVGSSSNSLGNPRAWGLSRLAQAPSDKYVLFNGTTAGNGRLVNVDTNRMLRGLYFKSTASETLGFNFYGTATLSLGRGGITNYDLSHQTFTAPLALTHSQYWIGGEGGLTLTNLNLSSFLLEVETGGETQFTGAISGSGSFAIAGGRVVFGGTNSYSGTTWVHEGELIINGDNAASPEVNVAASGLLGGFGKVAVISGAGSLAPGQSAGILSASSLNPVLGLDFHFEFGNPGAALFNQPDDSGNDLLRLSAPTPFSVALNSANAISIYFASPPSIGDSFLGGFFCDNSPDFWAMIQSATRTLYVADPGGSVLHNGLSYAVWSAEGEWEWSTQPQTADFGAGDAAGRILRLRLLPPPGTYARWTYNAFPEATPPEDKTPDATPNSALFANLFSYAFGLDPLNPDLSLRPYGGMDGDELVLRYRRRKEVIDLKYLAQTSGDLTLDDWTTEALVPEIVDPSDATIEEVEIRRPLELGDDLLFLRVFLESI